VKEIERLKKNREERRYIIRFSLQADLEKIDCD